MRAYKSTASALNKNETPLLLRKGVSLWLLQPAVQLLELVDNVIIYEIDGFFGASSIERFAAERGIKAQAAAFKAITK